MNENIIASTSARARMLTSEEIAEIDHEIDLYPDKQAVGLEALKIVQKHQGWVSDESMLAIAKYLDIPISDLEGVATFFKDFWSKSAREQNLSTALPKKSFISYR